MAFKLGDFVWETTTTTGLADFALAGAVTEYRAFSAFMANGDTTHYSAKGGAEWETGIGTWVTGNTLQRTIVTGSSNTGAKVNFSAGTKNVQCSVIAASAQVGPFHVPIPALALRPRATNGAVVHPTDETSNGQLFMGYDFDGVTNQYAQFGYIIPKQIDVVYGISFIFHWQSQGGAVGDTVTWGAQSRAASDGDTFDGVWGAGVEVTETINTTSAHHISTETSRMTVGNTWTAGDYVIFQFYRNAASDTSPDVAILLAVEMILSANKGNDA